MKKKYLFVPLISAEPIEVFHHILYFTQLACRSASTGVAPTLELATNRHGSAFSTVFTYIAHHKVLNLLHSPCPLSQWRSPVITKLWKVI
jgi:hypothetical protein